MWHTLWCVTNDTLIRVVYVQNDTLCIKKPTHFKSVVQIVLEITQFIFEEKTPILSGRDTKFGCNIKSTISKNSVSKILIEI